MSQSRRATQTNRAALVLSLVVVVVAVIIVALLIVLNRPASTTPESASNRNQVAVPTGVPAEGNVMGDPNAPVTVEVWADYQCPYCRDFVMGPEAQLKKTLIPEGKVKLVYRNFAFIGQESVDAAAAAYCAQDQGRFWDYNYKLFSEQGAENSGTFSKANLIRFASDLGLNVAQFRSCLDSGKYLSKVQADTQDGRAKGVRATPTIFVNGEKIEGLPSYEQLVQVINSVQSK